jgi:predicted nucleic acid-binding protein
MIALDRIGLLHILPKLFGRVIRPQAVVDELYAGKSIYGGSESIFDGDWIDLYPNPKEMILRKELGAGETAVIALALKLNADLIILDDLAARNVANGLNIKLTGTLGIILAAHKKGILPEITAAINDLQSCGFRISSDLINKLINQ